MPPTQKAIYMHYCDIFTECFHCPVPFCPYEKLDDRMEYGLEPEDETEDEDEGW